MNKYKAEVKKRIIIIIETQKNVNLLLRKEVFDYCKQEGLIAASREFEVDRPIPYKKIIKEEFGLVI